MRNLHLQRWRLLVGVLVACIGACLATGPSAAARTKADATATPTPGVSVNGNELVQNNEPFVPRGVQIVGLVAPDDSLWGKYIPAHQHFGAAELAQAVADHANLIRFQVSEFGLDPSDPLYSASYVQEVQNGIELARSEGLDVIVSLQAEAPAGNEPRCGLPDAGAATAWGELAAMFASDHGVMFELYNEPAPGPTAANWQTWLNGGPVVMGASSTACTAVGMQTLVDEIRAEGASNVIILPGLAGETTLAGVPAVIDPSDPTNPQFAYGIHYPALTLPTPMWDSEFGNESSTRPVIITEWQANSSTNCVNNAPSTAVLLLDYLATKDIGVVGFAFDLPGTIITGYDTYAPTNYDAFTCGVDGNGAGQVLFNDYAGEAAQEAGSGLDAPRAWMLDLSGATRLAQIDPTLTASALNTPRTFVTDATPDQLSALSVGNAVPTETFTSEMALVQAIGSGTLIQGTRAVELLLGPASPAADRSSPNVAFHVAAMAAQSAGLLFVAAPQLGLMATLTPEAPKENWSKAFIRKRVAKMAARYADAIVLPSAVAQRYTTTYSSFAELATLQVRTAKRRVEVLDGLNVGNSDEPAQTRLSLEVRNTSFMVSGYRLTDSNGAGDSSLTSLLQWMYTPSSSPPSG